MNAEAKTKTKMKGARGLGRGLNALFDDEEPTFAAETPGPASKEESAAPGRAKLNISIEQLYPNPDQPRTRFTDESLEELAQSIREHGIIQPILARKKESSVGMYEIIAGERRWRAAQLAQLHEVPVNVIELDDDEVLQVALVENLQREDLNPVEEALGYQRLTEEHDLTQEQIARVIGKSRPHIANMLRLLTLPPSVRDHLQKGELSAGHARALVVAPNPEALAKEIIEKGLSVRATEALTGAGKARKKGGGAGTKDVDTVALEQDLSASLGMKVTIDSKTPQSGALKIEFKSLDQLDDLLQRLSKAPKVLLGD